MLQNVEKSKLLQIKKRNIVRDIIETLYFLFSCVITYFFELIEKSTIISMEIALCLHE